MVSLVLVAGGCGLSTNQSPEPLARENLPDDLSGEQADAAEARGIAETEPVDLWFVSPGDDNEVLTPIPVEVVAGANETVVLESLVVYSGDRLGDMGLRTAVPRGTTITETSTTEAHVLQVELSDGFYSGMVEGDGPLAFGQIVLTLSDQFGVNRVQFMRDGDEQPVQDGQGREVTRPVGPEEYTDLVDLEVDATGERITE